MANKPKKPTPSLTKALQASADPATAANQRVLADREARIVANQPEPLDLGLGLKEKPAESATEFFDEWDKRAFGAPSATITKIIYGPDALLDGNPHVKEQLEKYGRADYAEAAAEALRRKGPLAFKDPLMQRSIRNAISQFGKEKVAAAFRDRILRIPERTVEIDASDVLDPMIMGGNVLRDTVERYARPGMAYKFLSARCMDILGMRGYTIVKDERGDPVKAGTLFLGEIREEIAEARRQRFAAESEAEVRESEEAYRDAIARAVPDARRQGVSALDEGETVTAGASESEDLLGDTRSCGFRVERQGRVERRFEP